MKFEFELRYRVRSTDNPGEVGTIIGKHWSMKRRYYTIKYKTNRIIPYWSDALFTSPPEQQYNNFLDKIVDRIN